MSNRHVSWELPAYANSTLPPEESRLVREHLRGCPYCAAELAEWELLSVAARVAVADATPPRVPVAVWAGIDREPHRRPAGSRGLVAAISLLWQLLIGQVQLVRRAIWAASAVTMAVGLLVALSTTTPTSGGLVLGMLAPLVAAMGVALVYGPENDPGLEVALSTPTAPRLVLLARLTLVYGYNLGLALLATLALAAKGGEDPLPLISLWIGPMLFLSALALLLSLLMGATTALLVSMGLWSARVMVAADLGGGDRGASGIPWIVCGTTRRCCYHWPRCCSRPLFGADRAGRGLLNLRHSPQSPQERRPTSTHETRAACCGRAGLIRVPYFQVRARRYHQPRPQRDELGSTTRRRVVRPVDQWKPDGDHREG